MKKTFTKEEYVDLLELKIKDFNKYYRIENFAEGFLELVKKVASATDYQGCISFNETRNFIYELEQHYISKTKK